ncbi:PREDICTED: probable E3 ubiquitin-protein ligase RNF144A-A [Acropora digitifera]|uniref:probable E3 ubiquitin-protein ligase RNF144A-A n=1 Tax=Acropora digitifera TaxID=70779 RepID=UPI00077A3599|nr:PREDICTED: probable E3 ubiquitin-protein ligase RNF144A-A [Acropora digitifera]
MLPAVFTTAMPERGSVIRNCKAAGSRSSRACKPKSDLETFYCKICLCEYSAKKGQMLETCACKFCKECLQQYLLHSINNGSVLKIPCPDALCPNSGQIRKKEVALLVNDKLFQKYTALRKKKEIALDKTKAFCPIAGCDGVCSGVPGTEQPAVCKEHKRKLLCDIYYCYSVVISGVFISIRFVDILRENGEAGDIKECPLCQVLILREAGCAQMMCGHCKHIFCWHCLKSLDSDIMLRHYDKGPCRNKLGHSRASLFFHRTQVIAGFAFFGLMVLVASPFILLVSPCLLLSKCMFHK